MLRKNLIVVALVAALICMWIVAFRSYNNRFKSAQPVPPPQTSLPRELVTHDSSSSLVSPETKAGEDKAGCDITGTVASLDGSPIARALIECRQMIPDLTSYETQPAARWAALSDADGKFAVAVLPDILYEVCVQAEGYANQVASWSAKCGSHYACVLHVGCVLQGAVYAPGRTRVIPGISVTCTQLMLPGEGEQELLSAPEQTCSTDARGRFEFSGLVPGKYVLTTDFAWEGLTHGVASVNVVATRPNWVEVQMRDGHTLSGHVLDEESRRPIVDATVCLSSRLLATSDASGYYVIEGFPTKRTAFLTASAPGYSQHRVRLQLSEAAALDVDFFLPREHHVVGVVTDGTLPVEGARVAVIARNFGAPGESPVDIVTTATTGEDGRFAIDGVPSLAEFFFIEAQHNSRGTYFSRLEELPEAEVAIALRRAHVVTGVVVDADGCALQSAMVQATYRSTASVGVQSLEDSRHAYRSQWRTPLFCRTDLNGRFEFSQLIGESLELSVVSPRSLEFPKQLLRLELDGQLHDVVLQGSILTKDGVGGFVYDATSSPVSGAKISCVQSGSGPVRTTEADREGRFRFSRIPRGEMLRLRATSADETFGTVTEAVGSAADLNLVLGPQRILRCLVLTSTGKPRPGAAVLCVPNDARFAMLKYTKESGDARFFVSDVELPCRIIAWGSQASYHASLRESDTSKGGSFEGDARCVSHEWTGQSSDIRLTIDSD